MLKPTRKPKPVRPPNVNSLLFEHVVVLMLENRSFDHLFGYLGIGEGLLKAQYTNYLRPGDSSTTAFTTRMGGDYTASGEGPSHSLKQVNEQLFGSTKVAANVDASKATLSGFVSSLVTALTYDLKRPPTTSELQEAMNCFDPVQLPVLSTLARSFVLCDYWFADVPGPTMPNRAYVHAATSQGYTYNVNWTPQFTCKTLYDRISATPSRSWRVYYHDHNDVLELYPTLAKTPHNNVLFENTFFADVAADSLPSYSFITPAFIGTPDQPVNSMHAPADVRPGEKLVADVYNALRSKDSVWQKTLLVVLFDEHGGYFDHVKPPAAVSPDGIPGRLDQTFLVPFDFDRLGLRVPAILISPWFEPAIDSTIYSHSTIPGTVIEAFGLKGGFLTARDKAANRLTRNYFINDGKRKLRTNTPDLTVPVQPRVMDSFQRELLAGSVHLDPHPELRNEMRTADIRDPQQAQLFMRTQISKHLEHYFASGTNPKEGRGSQVSADNQLPASTISPSRIATLKASAPGRRSRGPRP